MAPKKKAQAPAPKVGGYDAAKERIRKAQEVYRIHPEGTEVDFTYAPNNIPIRVRSIIRDLYSKSLDEWLFARGAVDVQTYADIWWISRLASGEDITRQEVHEEWDDKCAGVEKADISDTLIVETSDSGEAEGPST